MNVLFWIGAGFMIFGIVGLLIEVKNAPEVDFGEDEEQVKALKKIIEEQENKNK